MLNRKYMYIITCLLLAITATHAQDQHRYQTDFSKEELAARRAVIFNSIGNTRKYNLRLTEYYFVFITCFWLYQS
ncbi:MAG: hypothetical protein EAZ17_09580, partial [Sphingobacteriales bacterium]